MGTGVGMGIGTEGFSDGDRSRNGNLGQKGLVMGTGVGMGIGTEGSSNGDMGRNGDRGRNGNWDRRV